jgi:cell division protein FtsI/penicillin-binding protein 2
VAAPVLGYAGTDNTGLSGLELQLNKELQGTPGSATVVRDALGQAVNTIQQRPARDGRNVFLTLDSHIQANAEQVLEQTVQEWHAKDATAIVMDPHTGAILAMAQEPGYNANATGTAHGLTLEHAVTDMFEPGSVFKVVTIGGALSQHDITPNTAVRVPGSLQVADRVIHDAEPHGLETLTVAQILAQSSNIGAVEIGMREGPRRFDHWVREFGYARPTGIDFPGEERGIVPRPSQYSGSTMGNLPMGQGLSVTPIQMAAAYSAIADGGILRRPRLVLRAGDQRVGEPGGRRVISAATAAKLRRMLEGVLAPGGTASEVSVPGYTLAGKTGTAQKVVHGTYSDSQFVASFVGFAPASNPRLLVAIVVDTPTRGSYYGGTVAAPAFGEIARFALPYLGIRPS